VTSVRGVHRWPGRLAVLTGLIVLPAAGVAVAGHATADTRPGSRTTPPTVSADALPTVQVDGVVWSQAIVGNTVYAGGRFTTARPAGAALGTRTVKRSNLLAYDIRTGVLKTSFAPTINGQVLSVVASPDGRRVYVGGEFTIVNGQRRGRVAAFDTATGKLVTTFAPALDQRVRAIVPTSSRVYLGGAFSTANGLRRTRIAAFSPSNGALLSWAPKADDGQVLSLVAAPGGTRIVVGGQFTKLNGKSAPGLGAVDAVSAAVGSFPVNRIVRDSGKNAGITSLTTDGKLVYGTGYNFGGGNFEGTFAATAAGALVWLEDCHGDTYSAAPAGPVIYTVGHAHSCSTIGSFPEVVPRVAHRALAFTTAARGTVQHLVNGGRYADFGGLPAPRPLIWFPDLTPGTYTGQTQAAWSVAANSSYVVLGGEFPAVNGTKQQGLVRFAISSLAPNKQGPMAKPADLAVQATPAGPGQVQVTYRTTWDRDNELLRYTVKRTDLTTPLTVLPFYSRFWRISTGAYQDSGLISGRTYTYQVTATDPFGNSVSSARVSATAP
jgi:hypothetical protein